jgi:hypothetical protein
VIGQRKKIAAKKLDQFLLWKMGQTATHDMQTLTLANLSADIHT